MRRGEDGAGDGYQPTQDGPEQRQPGVEERGRGGQERCGDEVRELTGFRRRGQRGRTEQMPHAAQMIAKATNVPDHSCVWICVVKLGSNTNGYVSKASSEPTFDSA